MGSLRPSCRSGTILWTDSFIITYAHRIPKLWPHFPRQTSDWSRWTNSLEFRLSKSTQTHHSMARSPLDVTLLTKTLFIVPRSINHIRLARLSAISHLLRMDLCVCDFSSLFTLILLSNTQSKLKFRARLLHVRTVEPWKERWTLNSSRLNLLLYHPPAAKNRPTHHFRCKLFTLL